MGAAHRRGTQRSGLRDRIALCRRSTPGGAWRDPPALEGRPASCANLLIDATGNTHRAEFCIDKLYRPTPPPAAWGCWNCVPSRCLRMRRMSLTQQFDERPGARFWHQPLPSRTADALGHRTASTGCRISSGRTFATEIAEMGENGLAFRSEWFAPHHEFRFPRFGDFKPRKGAAMEVPRRAGALERLGEEGITAGGFGALRRFVGERLQLKATGLIEGRHVLAATDGPYPLQPPAMRRRIRRWRALPIYMAPVRPLHPTIWKPTAPILTFRHLGRAQPGQRAISRGASRGLASRGIPGQRLRSGRTAPRALFPHRTLPPGLEGRQRRATPTSRSRWTSGAPEAGHRAPRIGHLLPRGRHRFGAALRCPVLRPRIPGLPLPHRLLAAYPGVSSRYDEMLEAPARPRPALARPSS